MNWGMFEDVLAYAIKAHEGQQRKFNGRPYITHPLRVAFLLMEWFPHEQQQDLVLAAILHDVIEDCPDRSLIEIQNISSELVAQLVEELTNEPKDIRMSRVETKERDRDRIKNISVMAKCIKAADRYCNLSDLQMVDGEREFKFLYANESRLLVSECFEGTVPLNIVYRLYMKIEEVLSSL